MPRDSQGPARSGSLLKDEAVTKTSIQQTKGNMEHLERGAHPSRLPNAGGFFLACFVEKAGVPPDERFASTTTVFAAFTEAAGFPAGWTSAVGAPATQASAPEFPLASASTAFFAAPSASASLAATSYFTDTTAFIASMHKSACARHA